jgi:hypothetical protein
VTRNLEKEKPGNPRQGTSGLFRFGYFMADMGTWSMSVNFWFSPAMLQMKL